MQRTLLHYDLDFIIDCHAHKHFDIKFLAKCSDIFQQNEKKNTNEGKSRIRMDFTQKMYIGMQIRILNEKKSRISVTCVCIVLLSISAFIFLCISCRIFISEWYGVFLYFLRTFWFAFRFDAILLLPSTSLRLAKTEKNELHSFDWFLSKCSMIASIVVSHKNI